MTAMNRAASTSKPLTARRFRDECRGLGLTVGLQTTCPLGVSVCTAINRRRGQPCRLEVLTVDWAQSGVCWEVRGGFATIQGPALHTTPRPGSFWETALPSEFLQPVGLSLLQGPPPSRLHGLSLERA